MNVAREQSSSEQFLDAIISNQQTDKANKSINYDHSFHGPIGNDDTESDDGRHKLTVRAGHPQRPSKALTFCVFGCLTSVGMRDRILREIAFFPPPVPGYIVRIQPASVNDDSKVHNNQNNGCCLDGSQPVVSNLPKKQLMRNSSSIFKISRRKHSAISTPLKFQFLLTYWNSNKHSSNHVVEPVDISSIIRSDSNILVSFNWLCTQKKQAIGCLTLTHSNWNSNSLPFLIVSHGNATDLGYMVPNLYSLCIQAKCNVLGYEYTGYGQSSGQPTEKNTLSDIRAAYIFATQELKIPPCNIIIYGQSVGSGPSCDLAADTSYPIGGLILHSPLASGVRIIHENIKKSPFFDCFCNADKIRHLKCPILLVHGVADNQVSYRHSIVLFKAAVETQRKNEVASKMKKNRCCGPSKVVATDQNIDVLQPSLSSYVTHPVLGYSRITEISRNQVQLILVTNANHNDIEDVMGSAFYERIRRFCSNVVTPSVDKQILSQPV